MRAGEVLEPALLSVCKEATIGKILIQTNETTGEPAVRHPHTMYTLNGLKMPVFPFSPSFGRLGIDVDIHLYRVLGGSKVASDSGCVPVTSLVLCPVYMYTCTCGLPLDTYT